MAIVNPQKSNYQVWDGDAYNYNLVENIVEKDLISGVTTTKTFNSNISGPSLIALSNGMCAFFAEVITDNSGWAEDDIIFTLPVSPHYRISSSITIGANTPTFGSVSFLTNGDIKTDILVGGSFYVNINFIFVPKSKS